MSNDLEKIFEKYKIDQNTAQLASRLSRLPSDQKYNLYPYAEIIKKAVCEDPRLFEMLFEKPQNQFVIKFENTKEEVSKDALSLLLEKTEMTTKGWLQWEMDQDLDFLLSLIYAGRIKPEGGVNKDSIRHYIDPLAKGDVSAFVELYEGDNDTALDLIELYPEAFLEKINIFYQKTGNLQLFRFLLEYTQDENIDHVTQLLKDDYGIEFMKEPMLGEPFRTNSLLCIAALPNGELFDRVLKDYPDQVKRDEIYYPRSTDEDGYGGFKLLADVTDYIALAPVSDAEKARRLEAVLKVRRDLDLCAFSIRDNAEVDALYREIRESLGFSNSVIEGHFMAPLAYHALYAGPSRLFDRFYGYYAKLMERGSLSGDLRKFMYTRMAQIFDAEGVFQFTSIPGLDDDQLRTMASDTVKDAFKTFKSAENQHFNVDLKTLPAFLGVIYHAKERYGLEATRAMLERGVAQCRLHQKELRSYDYHRHMLKLSYDLQENQLDDQEIAFIKAHPDWFDAGEVRYLEKVLEPDQTEVIPEVQFEYGKVDWLYFALGVISGIVFGMSLPLVGATGIQFYRGLVLSVITGMVSFYGMYKAFEPKFRKEAVKAPKPEKVVRVEPMSINPPSPQRAARV